MPRGRNKNGVSVHEATHGLGTGDENSVLIEVMHLVVYSGATSASRLIGR